MTPRDQAIASMLLREWARLADVLEPLAGSAAAPRAGLAFRCLSGDRTPTVGRLLEMTKAFVGGAPVETAPASSPR